MPTSTYDFTKPVFSINETAAYLGISRVTVYKLIKEGQLHPIHIGKRTLIQRAELDRLIAVAA